MSNVNSRAQYRTRGVLSLHHCMLASMLMCFCAALLPGCGPQYPDCYPVVGKVTVNGKPLTQGTITFYPSHGRSALGKIASDGTYTLTTFNDGDGALPADHVVVIKATEVIGPASPRSFDEELAQARSESREQAAATVKWLVPQKYSRRETTPLKATVEQKRNQFDFEISVP